MSRTSTRGLLLSTLFAATILTGAVGVVSLPVTYAQNETAGTEEQQPVGQQQEQQQQQQDFTANLTGDAEVPPVTTNATGTADLELNDDADEMSYDIEVEDIEGATQAHIHQAAEGENGDVVVGLFNATEPTDVNDGTLEAGDFTAEDFVGPLQGQNMSDLVDIIQDGQAYVNVHTESNPAGEIRGTIELAPADDTGDSADDNGDDSDSDSDNDDNDDNNNN